MSSFDNDRRRTRRRHRVEDHGVLSVRIRPGYGARLIDVSADGALIETNCRLLPGNDVELHVETHTRRLTIRGRVLRCDVVHLRPSSVSYRGAIGFDRSLPWFIEEDGYRIPIAEERSGVPFRADATPKVV